MRRISGRLLACTMMVGSLALVATPAMAKDKKSNEVKAPEISTAFRAAGEPVEKAIAAKDFATANAGIGALEAAAVTPYEKYVAAHFRLQIAASLGDTAQQFKAVETILSTGQADPAELPAMYFYAGNFAFADGKYELATERLTKALELGYTKNNAQLMLAESYLKTNRLDEAFAIARKAIATARAAGEQVPVDWFNRPASAAQKAGRSADFIDFLALRNQSYPTPENWRNSTILYLQAFKPEKGTTLDALRLLDATGAMQTRQEFYEWATVAADSGLPGESVKAYEAGLKAGAIAKSDAEFAKLSKDQASEIAKDKGELGEAERAAAASATGKIASATGDAWLGYGDYAKAVAMYRLALQKGGVDLEATNTRLGIALAQSGDDVGAQQAFAAVTGPRASLARLWSAYVAQKLAASAAATATTPAS
ncbi:hypothetical protein FSZ31_09785 [Sphingorhabdus soli]|uniref:Uncharacterized protein n=1 Tax=Flavisphingopyxis soli TaxID=2601267 RepID=A0A5C6UBK4_9SPHN|nr:hypothetical protein [Sphingorhabdus soli]TXC69198.1 hypothetical protein FSZ31_09785 [Sphingorhabdus soli]